MGFQLIKNFLWEKRNRVLWKSAENLRKSQNQTEIAWRIMTDIANDFQETFRPIQWKYIDGLFNAAYFYYSFFLLRGK